ncbi:MAG: gliding motility protein GldM [Bacteroidales bacterium]|nr:gliding motility protein GldM [Bacteroidales bacterium]
MAHGKETPRQKMIGMMYLVLTALLALNVSKEVLNAFLIVNNGLQATNESFQIKSSFLYNEIEKEATLNPAKAGPVQEAALEVQHWAHEMYEYVEDIKKELIEEIEKVDSTAADSLSLAKNMKDVKAKDNYDAPTHILLSSDVREIENCKARALKNKLFEYKSNLLDVLKRDEIKLVNKNLIIEQLGDLGIDTYDNPEAGDDHPEERYWEYKKFYHTPFWATLTILTQIQSEVLNAEAVTVEKLYSSISASEFKFNKLEATVIPNTSYVLQGNEFRAEVFLAAFDTTKKPVIMVGDYTIDEKGTYKMVGKYSELEVDEQNRGIYSSIERALNPRKIFKGLIRMTAPDGTDKYFPFEEEYTVTEANIIISPIKMNLFYVAVDNPVRISVPSVKTEQLRATINNGKITRQGNEFNVVPTKPGKAIVNVSAEIDGKLRSMGSMEFRVKTVPDPNVMIGGLTGGNIEKSLLTVLDGAYAVMPEWFEFELKFKIISFTISTTDKGGFVIDEATNSSKFTERQMSLFKNLSRGQKFTVEDVKAIGPDGGTRTLNSTVFRIK